MKIGEGNMYQVKLISTHCHTEDAITEMIQALDSISVITQEIFASIEEKIRHHKAHVQELNGRAALAAEQVFQLKSSPKGIKILSSAKYNINFPEDSQGLLCPFPSLQVKNASRSKIPAKMNAVDTLQNYMVCSPVKDASEFLQFYHVRDSSAMNCGIERCENSLGSRTELGNPSLVLETADSFQSFCTAENPYQHYRVAEPEAKSVKSKLTPADSVQTKQLRKISSIEVNSSSNIDDFYYHPSSREIPSIDVPDQLPDLPGIVDTFNFTSQASVPNSVPSFLGNASAPLAPNTQPEPLTSAPNLSTETPAVKPVSAIVILNVAETKPMDPSISSSVTAPPPINTLPTPTTNTGPAPPPPPPPPPMPDFAAMAPLPSGSATIIPKPLNPPSSKATPRGDDRSSLMAAIRDAGGSKKLRSARASKQSDTDQVDEKKTTKQDTGGPDLMADLKNSLAMRRRGISGMQDSKRQGGLGMGDIMNKLASIIPTVNDMEDELGGSISDNDDWDV